MSATERFLRYVKTDTRSDPNSGEHPSTRKQFALAHMLADELKALGLTPTVDEHCYVYASIPANAEAPAVGFIAHMDTEPVVSGTGVDPQIVAYQGGDVTLRNGIVISEAEFPALKEEVGNDLIVTDGTTLLGADDNAGIAAIMEAAAYLTAHPEIPHGTVGIAFTPDEEIGEGALLFDVPCFGCDYAYTVDGGRVGEISYETFNAASAVFTLRGVNIHPGAAKGKMINCCLIAAELLSMFPKDETPATTEGREGFYHIESVETGIETGKISLIIRDHDAKRFEERKAFVSSVRDALAARYGEKNVQVEIKDSYRNCKEKILPHMHLVEHAKAALESLSVRTEILPVRGGTDGATLSYMGLPCPNLGTGGHNCHSVREYISVQSLEKNVEVLLAIIKRYAKSGANIIK